MSTSTRQVPNVTQRSRIPASAIREVVHQITKRFPVERIVLFGSYARGNPRPESDVDLLVVMRTRRKDDESLRIRRAVPCNFGLDLIVHTAASLRRRLQLGDYFLRDVMQHGKVLYEAAHR